MKLNFSEHGSGEPVILIHGLFGSMTNLGLLAQALRDHYHVYSIDLRNHGESFHHDEMDYAAMADDVVRFMADQSLEHASVVGHSMGGKVAMQVALNAPEKVSDKGVWLRPAGTTISAGLATALAGADAGAMGGSAGVCAGRTGTEVGVMGW